MGRNVKLKDLSKPELMEQLRRCWRHFRACKEALDGKTDVQPVNLLGIAELGDCDDLELFYTCMRKGGVDDGEE